MKDRIPREWLDTLLAKSDLVALISARIPLKKAGANHQARCPFHSEKTASFSVSPTRQTFHCFGCGTHGNAVGFLMDYDRMTFIEAVETLASQVGMEVPRIAPPLGASAEIDPEVVYAVQAAAEKFYARRLRESPEAIDYLKGRGITGETARRYRLGFAPQGWRSLPSDWDATALVVSGLRVDKDGRQYDRFRERIMFPIRDARGRVAGFGGRVLGDGTPKYLNSPQSATFDKGRTVYGLFEALEADKRPARIIVAEGNFDAIALAQAGFSAVATLGTAPSSDHAALLFRYAPELVFCFDGDGAGRAAAWRAVEACAPVLRDGKTVRFIDLPTGHDPDSLLREEGSEAFSARIEAAKPLSEFLFGRLEETGLGSIEAMAAAASTIRPVIAKVQAPELRGLFETRLLAMLGKRGSAVAGPTARLK